MKIIYAVLIILVLLSSSVQAFIPEDPSESAWKNAYGIEIVVQNNPIYLEGYYSQFLASRGQPSETPIIVTSSTPTNVIMVAKIPQDMPFYPIEENGVSKAFRVKPPRKEGGYEYLEYTLLELGKWTFLYGSRGGYEKYTFTLAMSQYTLGGDPSNPGVPTNTVRINLCKVQYEVGDTLCFQGEDLTNANIQLSYAGTSGISPKAPVKAVAGNTRVLFVDTSGRKNPTTLDIVVSEGGIPALVSNNSKLILTILALIILVWWFKVKKKR